MSYGFELQDIMDFDDLADWLEDHINKIGQELGFGKVPKSLKGDIEKVMKETLKDEIKEYGWTGDEELPSILSINMFHSVFATFNKNLYSIWFRRNVEELEPDSPFMSESVSVAMDEIKEQYEEEGVELTNKLLIQELKRGLHVRLFDMVQSLEYTLEHESNVASIKPNGFRATDEVVGEMEKVMEQAMQVEKQVNGLIQSIENLDYSTTIDS
ncbi:hypothetical protein GCM10008986_10440 [Salinibacillus aidingensis]|uniref:Uncharacterized protein n=1 Tax=Salinibacillus aidingensis TaxID=237684 RepID=A0ABP3KXE0_9BACI